MANNTGWIRQLIEMLLRLLTSSKSSGTSGSAGGTSRPQGGAGSAKLKPQPHKKPKKPSGGTTSSAAGSKSPSRGGDDISVGQLGGTRTIEIAPPAKGKLTISYDPSTDNDPDAGEIIWTWVPYEEKDGRGKDRPVLIIGRQNRDRVYAVRLTSKSHDGDRDYLSIGSGAWDPQGRPSWVDIDQVYSVHHDGMRREAAALDLKRFAVVADALVRRYGWAVAGK
ncbi:type II toxin-antitoxin system PemK/MazF family toxin [Microbacterium sp. YY-03]|uniref:type II toxin-antitoxin system PemK/MazF family toxin n=1 Tax=Microbacterium sp. YY-03 TaxID=3421636 RepID=UPI003D17118E